MGERMGDEGRGRPAIRSFAALLPILLGSVLGAPVADGATTIRTSLSTRGAQGSLSSSHPAISGSGRFVVFVSDAANLVAGDRNGSGDVFVRDRDRDRDGVLDEPGAVGTRRVSLSTRGGEADQPSFSPVISASGRFVAFQSRATNLVAGDTNASVDVFVRDRDADRDGIFDEAGAVRTRRVSVSTSRRQANSASVDPAITADGRFVAFESLATNLVRGDTNARADVFVRDRDADRDGIYDEANAVRTRRVSVSTRGRQGDWDSSAPVISASGRFVSFWSASGSLVAGDTNERADVFVRDRDRDRDGIFDEVGGVRTRRVSVSTAGGQGDSGSSQPAISTSGRFVSFVSEAANLVPGDRNGSVDVFVRDRDRDRDGIFDEAGAVRTSRVSVSTTGGQGDSVSSKAGISATGRFVAFSSHASNLVAGDTNNVEDIFLRDRDPDRDGVFDEAGAARTWRVSVSTSGGQADAYSSEPAISASGRFVAFHSDASNLVGGDTNGWADVFTRGPRRIK